MEVWLMWVIVGFVLVIAELMTGTFYLLVLGAGAFVAAITDWAGAPLLLQAIVGGVVAVGGALLVHHWHRGRPGDARSNLLDRGQPVVLEGWSNEGAGLARVKYRGASWDARLAGGDVRPTPGATLYIDGMEGNTLIVVPAEPAPARG